MWQELFCAFITLWNKHQRHFFKLARVELGSSSRPGFLQSFRQTDVREARRITATTVMFWFRKKLCLGQRFDDVRKNISWKGPKRVKQCLKIMTEVESISVVSCQEIAANRCKVKNSLDFYFPAKLRFLRCDTTRAKLLFWRHNIQNIEKHKTIVMLRRRGSMRSALLLYTVHPPVPLQRPLLSCGSTDRGRPQ